MESSIFTALPSIHITLLSIMIALYSVFAIYAYQKINEYKQKIDHLISDTKNLIIDIPRVSVDLNPPFEKDGAIDWEKSCKLVLQDIRFEFYSFNNSDSFPSKEKTIELGDKLVMLFQHMFSAYPFYSKSYHIYSDYTDKVEEYKATDLTKERLSEMTERLYSLNNFYHANTDLIERFISQYIEVVIKREKNLHEKYLKEQQKHNLGISDEDTLNFFSTSYKRRLQEIQRTPSELIMGFKVSETYLKNTAIPLRKEFDQYQLFSKTYQVKRWGLLVIRYAVFSMIMGIITPLTLLKLHSVHPNLGMGTTMFGSLEFFLLGCTTGPYLYLICSLYKKLKALEFK